MTYVFIKPGRGAWTTTGGYLRIRPTSSNPAGFLRAPQTNEATPGSHFVKGVKTQFPYEVTYEAVKAIQRLVGALPDGQFGSRTAASVVSMQESLHLTPDGIVGPATVLGLVKPIIIAMSVTKGVPVTDLGGIFAHESSADLGAVGAVDGSDVGGFQINMSAAAAKDFTIAQCVDPTFSSAFTGEAMADFYSQWEPRVGPDLARTGAIANHNSPLQAQMWMKHRSPQTIWIKQYVTDAREAGKVFA
jgi:hypothetical protein